MAKKIYIDKRTTVNGKSSAIDNDNKLDLNNHIKTIITETVTTPTATEIPFDNTVTGDLFATNVQDAIDEFSWLAVEWQYATVNITDAQLRTMGSSPIDLLPAPGANLYYDIRSITIIHTNSATPITFDFGATDILNIYNRNINCYIDNSFLTVGLPIANAKYVVTFVPSTPIALKSNGVVDVPVLVTDVYANQALRLTNINGNDASQGNGTMVIKIEYKINSL